MIFVDENNVLEEQKVKIKSGVDCDGDYNINVNGVDIGYFCCITGMFRRYYITPAEQEGLPSQWKIKNYRTTVETYSEAIYGKEGI